MDEMVVDDSLTLDLNEYIEQQPDSLGNLITLPCKEQSEKYYDSDETCLSVGSNDIGLNQLASQIISPQERHVNKSDKTESQDSGSILPPSQFSLFSTLPKTPDEGLFYNEANVVDANCDTQSTSEVTAVSKLVGLDPLFNASATVPSESSTQCSLNDASSITVCEVTVQPVLSGPMQAKSGNSTPTIYVGSPILSRKTTHTVAPFALGEIRTAKDFIPPTKKVIAEETCKELNESPIILPSPTTVDDVLQSRNLRKEMNSNSISPPVSTRCPVLTPFVVLSKQTASTSEVLTQSASQLSNFDILTHSAQFENALNPSTVSSKATTSIDEIFTQTHSGQSLHTTNAGIFTQTTSNQTTTKLKDIGDPVLFNDSSSNDDDCIIVGPIHDVSLTQTSGVGGKRKTSVEKRKCRRRKKAKFTQSSQYSLSQVRCEDTEEPPYSNKLHLKQMEELNIIEAKISSVEKVLTMKQSKFYGQVESIMKGSVKKRITDIRAHLYDKQNSSESDSEEKRDHSQLLRMRENRLEAILVARDRIMEKLDELKRLNNEVVEIEDDIECSQSILPVKVPLYKSFTVKMPKTNPESETRPLKPKTPSIPRLKPSQTNNPTSSVHTRPVIYIVSNAGTKTGSLVSAVHPLNIPHNRYITPVSKPINQNKITQYTMPRLSQSQVPVQTPTPLPHNIIQPNHGIVPYITPKPIKLTQTTPPAFSIAQSFSQPIFPLQTVPSQILPPPSLTQAIIPATNQTPDTPCDKLCFNLGLLMKRKVLKQGSNVLKFKSVEREHTASLTSNGSILTSQLQVYVTPVAWIRGVTGRCHSKITAFKMVTYEGVPLYDIAIKTGGKSGTTAPPVQKSGYDSVTSLTKSPIDDLIGYLTSCKIRLVQNDEFFITSQLCERHGGSEYAMMEYYIDNDS